MALFTNQMRNDIDDNFKMSEYIGCTLPHASGVMRRYREMDNLVTPKNRVKRDVCC